MDIQTYRRDNDLSQAAFADQLCAAGFKATQSLVSQWENGDVKLTPERALQIEQITGGSVSRSDLRPDLWPAEAGPSRQPPAANEGDAAVGSTLKNAA